MQICLIWTGTSRAAGVPLLRTGTGSARTRRVLMATTLSATSHRTLTRGSSQERPSTRQFMCGKIDGAPFAASLGSKSGVPCPRCTEFQVARRPRSILRPLQRRHDQGLQGIGMKPVCDHPSYCKTDKQGALPRPDSPSCLPGTPCCSVCCLDPPMLELCILVQDGWCVVCEDVQCLSVLCRHTAAGCDKVARGVGWALLVHGECQRQPCPLQCAVRTLTRGRHPGSAHKTFMCGKVDGAPFAASLGAKNGVPARQLSRSRIVKASAYLGPLQRRHDQGLRKDGYEAGVRPPELLQD